MRFIVDEMPDYEEECPFYKSMLWISDCVKKRHACFITKKSCDRTDGGCHMLKPIRAEKTMTNDYIRREDAKIGLSKTFGRLNADIANCVIDKVEPADVVPVVRCRDCKHHAYDEIFSCYWCEYPGRVRDTTPDGFCEKGEG